MRFLFVLLVLGTSLFSKASTPTAVGAEQAGMGGYNATISNAFAIHNNIATTAFLQNSAIGVTIDNRFLFANIYHLNAGFTWQKKKLGAFSLGNSYTGYSAFHHNTIFLGYARKFGDQLSAGLSFNHHFLAIAENGAKHLTSIHAGMQFQPVERIKIGINIRNPIKQKLEKVYNETLESSIQLGVSYHTEDKFLIGLQFTKNLKYPLQVNLGTAYQIHEILSLRAGVAINPTIFSAGIGIQAKHLQIDLASTWNIKLGISPQISLQYEFPHK